MKYKGGVDYKVPIMININMRCIEMYPKLLGDAVTATININMRCIEILQAVAVQNCGYAININMRCIEMHRTREFYLKDMD